jgi:hypothetical protein
MFLKLIKGKYIWINTSNEEQIQDSIGFREFDSLFVLDIVNNPPLNLISKGISSLISFPIHLIQEIISSFSFHLKNETQLFQFYQEFNRTKYLKLELSVIYRFWSYLFL